jgi:hypothetical protein
MWLIIIIIIIIITIVIVVTACTTLRMSCLLVLNCCSQSKRYSPNAVNCMKSSAVSLKCSEQTADKAPHTLFIAVLYLREKRNKIGISFFIRDAISAGFSRSFLLYNFSLNIIIIIYFFLSFVCFSFYF